MVIETASPLQVLAIHSLHMRTRVPDPDDFIFDYFIFDYRAGYDLDEILRILEGP